MVERPCPKELRDALVAFAKAVKKCSDMERLRCQDPKVEYHLAEYLSDMEGLLTLELVTALPTMDERLALLYETGLDYLEVNVQVQSDLMLNEKD